MSTAGAYRKAYELLARGDLAGALAFTEDFLVQPDAGPGALAARATVLKAAGRPLDAMALIGMGFRTLSMSPPSVGPVKTMLRSLDVAALRQYMAGLYQKGDHSLRDKLRSFAKDHGVII